ncbi:MAG: Crp/Fnr family transcriptional regulator [Bacteroidia bacterium]|nr:Crp/Fnr family transcriptional regulator [Bacteroidia bacterium]
MNIQYLKEISFLKGLSNEEYEGILKHCQIVSFDKNEVIFKENSYLKTLPIILNGAVRVLVINQEEVGKKEVLLYHIKAREACSSSIASGIFNEKIDIRVEAETDCDILFLPFSHFAHLISKHPEIFEELLQNYLQLFKKIVNSVSALYFYPLDKRILYLLKEKAKLRNNSVIDITHEEIARELASTREVITRILHQLEEQGHLKIERGKIRLIK